MKNNERIILIILILAIIVLISFVALNIMVIGGVQLACATTDFRSCGGPAYIYFSDSCTRYIQYYIAVPANIAGVDYTIYIPCKEPNP